MARNWQQSIGD